MELVKGQLLVKKTDFCGAGVPTQIQIAESNETLCVRA